MWRTSQGERVLKGAEWRLFAEALTFVSDMVVDMGDPDEFDSGVAVFDRLQRNQKLAMLTLVGQALKDERTPSPELTAVAEGAVAAVFAKLRDAVEIEIEMGESSHELPTWRALVLAACRDVGIDDSLPEASTDDLEEWDPLIDCLADRILWDADYAMEEQFLDRDPETVGELKKFAGISGDYFRAVAPDPTDDEIERIRRALREIVNGAK